VKHRAARPAALTSATRSRPPPTYRARVALHRAELVVQSAGPGDCSSRFAVMVLSRSLILVGSLRFEA
jgi:hypothetical protein